MNGSPVPVVLGVDIGTTHIKVLALSTDGAVLQVARAATPVGDDGAGPVHEAPALEALVTDLAREVTLGAHRSVQAVACASVAEEGFWLDPDGRVTYPSLAWYVPRPSPAFDAYARSSGDRAFEQCGTVADPIRTLAKWMWLEAHRPEALRYARTWLSISEYFAYRWSGEKVLSRSQASRMLLWDLQRETVLEEALSAVGRGPDCLPPVVPSGTVLGPLCAHALPGVPRMPDACVVVGGHDHPVGAFAVGVVGDSQVLDSLGTAESLMMPVAQTVPKAWMIAQGLEFGASAQGLPCYVMSAAHSGAHLKAWTGMLGGDTALLERAAESVPPGAGGLRLHPPGWHSGSTGRLAGLGPGDAAPTVYRALLEGWAFWARSALEALQALQPLRPPESGPGRAITAIGGGSERPLAMQIRASVLDRAIEVVDEPEAVALGSAYLALRALQPDAVPGRGRRHLVLPDPAWRETYQRLYEAWRAEGSGPGQPAG